MDAHSWSNKEERPLPALTTLTEGFTWPPPWLVANPVKPSPSATAPLTPEPAVPAPPALATGGGRRPGGLRGDGGPEWQAEASASRPVLPSPIARLLADLVLRGIRLRVTAAGKVEPAAGAAL